MRSDEALRDAALRGSMRRRQLPAPASSSRTRANGQRARVEPATRHVEFLHRVRATRTAKLEDPFTKKVLIGLPPWSCPPAGRIARRGRPSGGLPARESQQDLQVDAVRSAEAAPTMPCGTEAFTSAVRLSPAGAVASHPRRRGSCKRDEVMFESHLQDGRRSAPRPRQAKLVHEARFGTWPEAPRRFARHSATA